MPRSTLKERDAAAELLWKWALRLTGLASFLYVGSVKDFNVPSPVYLFIGGLVGTPHIVSLQRAINSRKRPSEDDDE